MLEEAQLAAGAQHALDLGERAAWSGTVHSTRLRPRRRIRGLDGQRIGHAVPHLIGTGAPGAAGRRRRAGGSGSTATTSVTVAG